MSEGYPWEVFDDQLPARRVALGHCMQEATAIGQVEEAFTAASGALFGIVVCPNLTALVCRHGRGPGALHWYKLENWAGLMPSPTVVL